MKGHDNGYRLNTGEIPRLCDEKTESVVYQKSHPVTLVPAARGHGAVGVGPAVGAPGRVRAGTTAGVTRRAVSAPGRTRARTCSEMYALVS